MLKSDRASMTDAELIQEASNIADNFPVGDGDFLPDCDVLRELLDELQYRFVLRPAQANESQSQKRLGT